MRRIGVLACASALVAGALSAATAAAPASAAEVLVAFRPGTSAARQQQALAGLAAAAPDLVSRAGSGAVVSVRLRRGVRLAAALRHLAGDAAVRFAEPDHRLAPAGGAPDRVSDGSQWGVLGDASRPANKYGSQTLEAWAKQHWGRRDVYVGIIDEGVDVGHPELAAAGWTNPFDPVDGVDNDGNGYLDDVNGWDFAADDNTVYDGTPGDDVDAHGTHIAGVIAADAADGTGTSGIGYGVTVIPAKFLTPDGGSTSDAVRALDYLVDLRLRHGMEIVAACAAWGGSGNSTALLEALDRAYAAGILTVAAAGNGDEDYVGDDSDAVAYYPVSFDTDGIVAATALTSRGALPGYANYGRTSVDLGAPGDGIWSTVPGAGYAPYSGTSMAAAHVAGALGLYASAHPGTPIADVRAALLRTAVPTPSLRGRTVTGGRLDVSRY